MRARREEMKCKCGEWIWLEEVHSDFCRMCHSVEHLCQFCNAFEPFTNRDGLCPDHGHEPECHCDEDMARAANRILASPERSEHMAADSLVTKQVHWIVNSLGELGVRIGGRCFFLYKGESLRYSQAAGLLWRPVGKREFGECAHPINYQDPTRHGEVDIHDGQEWLPILDDDEE